MEQAATGADLDFTGQVAIVTGGGGGLGSSFCLELARRGAAVVVNDLGGDATGTGTSSDYADDVVRRIRRAGGTAVANYDSVATASGGQSVVAAALAEFGRVDVVISNAGNQRNAAFGELSDDDIDSVLGVHLEGAFHVCQPAYRQMARQGYGRLVLVSSQSGIFGNPFRANYAAAKTGMIGLMNVIAQEAPTGVEVNCLFPNAGGGRLGAADPQSRPDRAWLAESSQLSRVYARGMTPEFVTPLAVYLASRACASSQNMYSALGGRYSRLFVGLTRGWYTPSDSAPSCEELVDRLAEIDDRSEFVVPLSGLDEMRTVVAAARDHGES